MKNKFLLLFFSILFAYNLSFSQGKCGTYKGSFEEQVQKHPEFYQALEKKNKELKAEHIKALKQLTPYKTNVGKKIIPVVVHNIYNGSSGYLSDEVIQDAINSLNKNFNGQSDKLLEMYQNQYIKTPDIFAAVRGVANIEFRLAKLTPSCETCTPEPTNGINRINTEITSLGSGTPDPVKELM